MALTPASSYPIFSHRHPPASRGHVVCGGFNPRQELQRPGNDLAGVRGVEQRPLHVDEVLSAREAFLVGSSLRVMPVVSWDGRPINGGVVHAASLAMDRLVYNDMTVVDGNDQLLPIPYGYVTGMRSQLT